MAADNKHRAEWTLQSRLHTAERGGPRTADTGLCNQGKSTFLSVSITLYVEYSVAKAEVMNELHAFELCAQTPFLLYYLSIKK